MCPNNNPITCPYNILHYKWYYIIKKRVPSESQDREYTIAYIRASGASEKFWGFSDAETAISLTNVVGTSNILSAHQESYVVPIYQSIKHRLHPSSEIPPTGWFPPNILPTGGAVAPPAPPLGTPLRRAYTKQSGRSAARRGALGRNFRKFLQNCVYGSFMSLSLSV